MRSLYLGIDTSNYKTSVALTDDKGSVIAEKSEFLDVPEGERGLRQSEAFFLHSSRLPGYIKDILAGTDTSMISAIGVSERPRRVEGSYMPCFTAGINAASILGSALRIPVYGFSHQEGHAAAILESQGKTAPGESLFFHLSGGTTEALLCRPDDLGYSMEIVGGTLDISIGQLLDRYGVALGYPFPAGRYLDDIAFKVLSKGDRGSISKTGVIPKIKIKDGHFNLSGAETRLMQFAQTNDSDEEVSRVTAELFSSIAGLLAEEAVYLSEKYGIEDIYMAGGVASSRSVRSLLSARGDISIRFGEPELSGDNACGTALLAKRIHETRNSYSGK